MGCGEDLGKGPANAETETLEKDKDQGVDAHEQREETKEKGQDRYKGESSQDSQESEKERRFSGRETRRGLCSERGDRGKARGDLRASRERR